jgi:DNA polymerase-1
MGELFWDEKKVGVIFGFLKQLLSFAKFFDTNNFIFTWDSKERKRTEIYSEYKANRTYDKTEEEKELDAIVYSQFDTIRTEVLPAIGFKNNFMLKGYEADDIIASIIKKYLADNFVIISSDTDLYQLLHTTRVSIFNSKTKKLYTEPQLIMEYNVDHTKWATVKAIAGCVSDHVPGVVGVGEKTAIKYINDELNPKTEAYQNIESFKKSDSFERNVQLVTLPYKGTPAITLLTQKETSYDGMYHICEKYGFQSLLKKEAIHQWMKNLNVK